MENGLSFEVSEVKSKSSNTFSVEKDFGSKNERFRAQMYKFDKGSFLLITDLQTPTVGYSRLLLYLCEIRASQQGSHTKNIVHV